MGASEVIAKLEHDRPDGLPSHAEAVATLQKMIGWRLRQRARFGHSDDAARYRELELQALTYCLTVLEG
jgi:hypothetical protein